MDSVRDEPKQGQSHDEAKRIQDDDGDTSRLENVSGSGIYQQGGIA
ncbi:hypothetical protein SJI19_18420 [Acerihabitans sp. TG2]|nr:hypothetical protein [Acerihabitans sp. TG2]MEA9392493.1 hypothetical protein [Acerihabitans sp. TG2]